MTPGRRRAGTTRARIGHLAGEEPVAGLSVGRPRPPRCRPSRCPGIHRAVEQQHRRGRMLLVLARIGAALRSDGAQCGSRRRRLTPRQSRCRGCRGGNPAQASRGSDRSASSTPDDRSMLPMTLEHRRRPAIQRCRRTQVRPQLRLSGRCSLRLTQLDLRVESTWSAAVEGATLPPVQPAAVPVAQRRADDLGDEPIRQLLGHHRPPSPRTPCSPRQLLRRGPASR